MNLKRIIICLLYMLLGTMAVNAQENLYLIKSIPQENLSNIINNYYFQKGYKTTSMGGFYVLPQKGNDKLFFEIIIEQNGADCYLYYYTPNITDHENIALIKELKKGHFKIKATDDSSRNNTFRNRAAALKTTFEKSLNEAANYSFNDEAQEEYDKINNISQLPNLAKTHLETRQEMLPVNYVTKPKKLIISSNNYVPMHNKNDKQLHSIEQRSKNFNTKVLKGSVVTIASGSNINATLQSAISSASMSQNDRITAVLSNDFCYNGYVIFPKETILYGTALNAKASSYGYGNGTLDLTFDQAMLPNGKKINLSVDKISYVKKGERALKMTRDVVIGAGAGILGGLISAALTGDVTQALIVGASIGAAGGGLRAISQKGSEIEIPEGSILNLKLNQPINISPYN